MPFVLQVHINLQQNAALSFTRTKRPSKCTGFGRKQSCMATLATPSDEKQLTRANNLALPIMHGTTIFALLLISVVYYSCKLVYHYF